MDDNYRVVKILNDIVLKNESRSKAYCCLRLICEQTLNAHKKGIKFEGTDRDQMKSYWNEFQKNPYDDTPAGSQFLQERNLKQCCEQFVESNKAKFSEVGFIPVIQSTAKSGGKGNRKNFWIGIEKIEEDDEYLESNFSNDIQQINYIRTPAEQIKLAFYVKPFFKNGELKNRSFKALGFLLTWMALAFVTLIILFIAAYANAFMGNQYITLQILNFAFLGLLAFLSIKYIFMPFLKLPDCRVIKAPLLMLGWDEYHAEIEMHRDFKEQRTRFTRFTSDCPICSGEITLSNGEKDYNLALVGRCSESPLLHVYTFDRALLKGKLLSENIVQ